MNGKTPPPLSQNSEVNEARDLLETNGWISDSPQASHDLYTRIIETTNSNIRTIVGTTTASKAKKKEWEMIRAAIIFLKDQFECAWEDEFIDRISKEVGERVANESTLGAGHPGHETHDTNGELIEKVTEALEKKFEEKLEDMVGKARTWKLSDESAFTQVMADRIEAGLGDKMARLTTEAEAAFNTATNVVKRCDDLMDVAKTRMEEMSEKLEKLSNNMPTGGGFMEKVHENWDPTHGGTDRIADTNGETRMSFAEVLRIEAEKRVERMTNTAAGNVARAAHAQAIRDAKAAFRKVVIREVGANEDLHWVTSLSENDLVHRANEALKSMTDEGDATNHASFISSRKIPGGALLYLADEAGAMWLRGGDRLRAWADEWVGEIIANFDVYEVVVERVPISFDITNPNLLRSLEPTNSLQANSITKARWIKPIEKRSPNQKSAYAMMYFTSSEPANLIIRNGIIIQGQSLDTRKSLPEPRRCLRCHKTGHFAKECKNKSEVCGHCAEPHSTRECTEMNTRRCALCGVDGHGSSDRSCPSFIRKVQALHERRADLRYRFFVGEDPETWVTTRDVQQEAFDDSWQHRLREQDAGWQRVERRGTGRLAGGLRGEGGGTPYGSARRGWNTTTPASQHTNKNQQQIFASQGTIDRWLNEESAHAPSNPSNPPSAPRAMRLDTASPIERARSNSLPSQHQAFHQSTQ